jgi:hypothetical protein
VKAPGFNPSAYKVRNWFQISISNSTPYRYNADTRAACERRVLACGRRLALEAGALSAEDVVALAKQLRAA